MWGGGARAVNIEVAGSPTAWLVPAERTTRLVNVFLQDAITVVPRRVTLTIGSKLEHNDFSAFEVEPSARVLWAASPTQTVWGAISRAVRTPGSADEGANFNVQAFPIGPGMVGEARVIGTHMRSEVMTSAELGYRAQIHPRLTIDLASFESRYAHLRATEPGAPFYEADSGPGHMVFPVYFANGFHARTRGLETSLVWRGDARFGLTVSHSLFWMRLEPDAGTADVADVASGDTPTYQLAVHPHVVVAPHLSLDATWYHVDDLPAQGVQAYDRVDARLGWTPRGQLEFAAGVRNLLHDRQLEFSNTSGTNAPTTVGSGVYGKVTWRL
jgi:iron complex outermembrane receptor protein